jgi:hypothetical protein
MSDWGGDDRTTGGLESFQTKVSTLQSPTADKKHIMRNQAKFGIQGKTMAGLNGTFYNGGGAKLPGGKSSTVSRQDSLVTAVQVGTIVV